MTGPRIPETAGPSGTFAALANHPAPDEPMQFAFGEHVVRALLIGDNPWFVLADLCRPLGLTQPHRVADRIDDDMKGRHPITTLGGTQDMTIVSEAGMYEVVIRSDKPEARRFRRWVTAEVLPAIRKTGSYSRYPAHPDTTALPSKRELAQWVIEAEERADRETAARLEAEARAGELAVPASAWNELAEAAGDYSVADAAKVLSRDPLIDIRERALFAYMAELGWVFRRDNRWKAYRTQLDAAPDDAATKSYVDLAPEHYTVDTPTHLTTLPRHLNGADIQPWSGLESGAVIFTYVYPKMDRPIGTLGLGVGEAADPAPSLCRLGVYSVDSSGNMTMLEATDNNPSLVTSSWVTQETNTIDLLDSVDLESGLTYAFSLIIVGDNMPQLRGFGNGDYAANFVEPRICSRLMEQTDLPETVDGSYLWSCGAAIYIKAWE